MSDPEHELGNHADFVSAGFKNNPAISESLKRTVPTSAIDPNEFDAVFVVGGLSPMYTFAEDVELRRLVASFYETGKPTALICHGTCVLLQARTADGALVVSGKRWTGFSNAEEDIVDAGAGMVVEPSRIQDAADQMRDTTFVAGAPFGSHAIRDANLITGQQGSSGSATAALVLELLGR